SAGDGYSIHVFLLPFIEQDNLFKAIDFSFAADDVNGNVAAREMVIPTFQCPSDPMTQLPRGWGGNNYRANNGVSIVNGYGASDANGANAKMPPPDGGFFTNSKY